MALTAALAACGGGGGGGEDAEAAGAAPAAATAATASTAGPGSASTSSGASTLSPAASEPVLGVVEDDGTGGGVGETLAAGAGSDGTRFVPGTYVGHWLGYQYGIYSGMSIFTAGGSLLRFSAETYGKLKAVGAADVVAVEATQPTVSSDRVSLGLAGDLYSDNNVYAFGTSYHLFNEMVSGSYDPARRRLALTVTPVEGSGHYFDACKYCDRAYLLPGRIHAFYSPVGTSSPAGFRLTRVGTQLRWTAATGVEHWMVSVFEEDEVRALGQDAVTSATLPYPGDSPATLAPPLGYHFTEFGARMMRPASARSANLPTLVKGRRYVGVIAGFPRLDMLYGSNEAVAYSSVRWTAP